MQEHSAPGSLIVKFKIPHGFSFGNRSSPSTTAAATPPTLQHSAIEPAERTMASVSAAKAATKKKSKIPSMHEPQTVVKIKVSYGYPPTIKLFTIHKSFICHYSTVFRNFFRDPENDYYGLTLHADKVEAFSNLVYWLYYQTVQGEDGTALDMIQLVHLGELAAMFQIVTLQNMVIDKLHEFLAGDNWSAEDYSSLKSVVSPAPSQPQPAARKMLVDMLAGTKDKTKFDKCINSTPRYGILQEVAQALKRYHLEGLEPGLRPASDYHVPVPAAKK